MAGALKTLFGALTASTFMSGVSLVYGEESIAAQDYALPMVVMVPLTGQYNNEPGYSPNTDQWTSMQWGITQPIDFYIWAENTSPTALPIDHVDATETVRQSLLSALQDQRAQGTDTASIAYGLVYTPMAERWQLMQNAVNRFGRALVVTVNVEITVPMATGQQATITTEQLNKTITAGPS